MIERRKFDSYDLTRETFTPAERQVFDLIALGLDNRSIALRLGIHECSVKKYVHLILEKLTLKNRTQVALRRWGIPFDERGASNPK
jgi:DNA-binding NarL/FixJ family response regulator